VTPVVAIDGPVASSLHSHPQTSMFPFVGAAPSVSPTDATDVADELPCWLTSATAT
jgi:hypothetical protein